MSRGCLNKTEEKYYLGVDFGMSKLGLALAENITKIAFAYSRLQNDKSLLEKIAQIIKEKNISKVIIGIPWKSGFKVNYKDKNSLAKYNAVENKVRKLGKAIQNIFPKIEIIYQNEMFTTKMAQANLKAKKAKNVSKEDDQEAARIILQSWLDS